MASPLSREMELFKEYYPKLCNTMTDIKNLLQYFVQKNIIKLEDQDTIGSEIKSCDQVKAFLKHISGPLQGGNTEIFYTMLDIMEVNGVEATKQLANELKITLKQQFSGKVYILQACMLTCSKTC